MPPIHRGTIEITMTDMPPSKLQTVPPDFADADYQRLLQFRTGLRSFLHWSEEQAAKAGLTAAQHQLMLAIRGHADARGPTIGEVAGYLFLRHHSVVGLVDRAAAADLVERREDEDDRRVVRLRLTPHGNAMLGRLSQLHVEELARLGAQMRTLWAGLDRSESSDR
jgi:DNA-binding MarR family transcriptional regulator